MQTTLKLDAGGVAGTKTWGVIHQRIVMGKPAVPSMGTGDARSERNIEGLLTDVHP